MVGMQVQMLHALGAEAGAEAIEEATAVVLGAGLRRRPQ
jgi:hypothetical protein